MYKTIFTYFASPQSAAIVAEVGGYIAEKTRAHLVGAHNSARISLYGGIPSDYLAQHNHQQRVAAESIEQSFKAALAQRDVAVEWRHKSLADTAVFGDLISQARNADLVIACANDEADPLNSFHDVPVRFVMESGRPVLLVPAKGKFTTVGERITVAWNDSRESSRAAFDALPLLAAASSVEVLVINPASEGAAQPAQDLVAALARHGVNAKPVIVTARAGDEGRELSSAMASHQSDLLVMGCYGRPRWRELVLGGVTQHVLKTMTTPVLMSH